MSAFPGQCSGVSGESTPGPWPGSAAAAAAVVELAVVVAVAAELVAAVAFVASSSAAAEACRAGPWGSPAFRHPSCNYSERSPEARRPGGGLGRTPRRGIAAGRPSDCLAACLACPATASCLATASWSLPSLRRTSCAGSLLETPLEAPCQRIAAGG